MSKLALAVACIITAAVAAQAEEFNGIVIGANADTSNVEFKRDTSGGFRGKGIYGDPAKAKVAEPWVIKEGQLRLGKPARVVEGKDIENGLSNPLFKNATAEAPVKCRLYTADADDAARKIKKGDLLKIIVVTGN